MTPQAVRTLTQALEQQLRLALREMPRATFQSNPVVQPEV
jgi:hypothetical protein